MTQERIVNECKPYKNDIDRRILYEITGVKIESDDDDSSSFEEDLSVLVSQVIGYKRSETADAIDEGGQDSK